MRPLARVVLAAVVVGAGPVLSACDSLDTFQIWDNKKKLAGERHPVFPDGVPGVTRGVPPELVKGYQEPEGGVVDPAKAAAEAAAAEAAKPKRPPPQRTASRPKRKPKPAAPPAAQEQPAEAAAQPQPTPAATTAPWPAQQQPAQSTTAPWPAPQPQAPWPGSR